MKISLFASVSWFMICFYDYKVHLLLFIVALLIDNVKSYKNSLIFAPINREVCLMADFF